MTVTQPRQLIGTPPRILSWPQFEHERRWTVEQGNHQLFVGPTDSGKTVLCRLNVRDRPFTIVWGTKKRDASLEAYIREGYVRIDSWPPRQCLEWNGRRWVRRPFNHRKLAEETGQCRMILWPEYANREDVHAKRDIFRKTLDEAYRDGGWTIVIDEGMFVARRSGLGLDAEMADVAYGARSNGVTLYLCLQRPAGIERLTWSSVSDAYIFKSSITTDLRELGTMGTADRRDVERVIQYQLTGHKFLHLPTRGQSKGWSISEVDPSAI